MLINYGGSLKSTPVSAAVVEGSLWLKPQGKNQVVISVTRTTFLLTLDTGWNRVAVL